MAEQRPSRQGFMRFVIAVLLLLVAVLGVMFYGYDHSSLTEGRTVTPAGKAL